MADEQPVFEGIDAALEHFENKAEDAQEEESEDSVAATDDQETEDEGESTELDTEDEAEDTDEESESDDEEEAEEESEEEFLFKIQDGDEEVTVTDIDEAKNGYMRQSTFTKKTQELAVERKEVDTEKAGLLELKAQYLEGLTQLREASSEHLSKFMGVDWQQLQKDDPLEFDEQKAELEAAQLAYQQTTQQQEQLGQELTKEHLEYAQTIRKQELELLQEFVPEAGTDEFGQNMVSFGTTEYGFSDDELGGILDHRMIRVLIDAQKYHDNVKKQDTGKEKVKVIKKSMKPKASKSESTAKARKAKARKQAFNKEGGLTPEEVMSLVG